MLLTKGTELFRNHLVAKQKSKETVRGYVLDLTMLDRFLSQRYNGPAYVEDLTESDVEAYLEMLQVKKQYAAGSINRHLNSIRSLCHFAYKKGWTQQNAAEDIESLKREQKERTYLTEDELTQFLEAIPHPLVQLAARTMAYTGLRVSECTGLEMEDVELENNIIYVVEGKGKKDRILPIAQSLKPYLEEYVATWRVQTSSTRFFATEKSGEISTQYLNRILQVTTEKLQWRKKVTCHILRHSFASNLVAKNVNIVKISKLLGHADLKTTSIYTHTSQKELSEAVDLLG